MSVAMLGAEWRHVPVRLDVERWASRQVRRRILVVVHTVTTGQRLLDVVRLFEGDLRVQVVFTGAPDVFSNGVREFLEGLRGVVLPWQQAVETAFDLAIAAGHEGIHQLHAPVIVVPHGAGHNKYDRARRGLPVAERSAYGLNRQWLIRDGAVVPEAIVLAHQEDVERLGRDCPEAVPAAAVVGDPVYDRIIASLPSRALYRKALGAGPRQRVVAVTTTWGPHSLLNEAPEVLDRLVTELSREDYRVVALLHPNAWSAHGEWQIHSWFAPLCRSGLTLVGQHADPAGVLVAADHVIGDHGSLALYGTVAGASVLLARYPESDVDPESAMGELSSFAVRLKENQSLRQQLARSASRQRSAKYERVAARITSEPGRFARNMRALIYRTLRLRRPVGQPVTEPARPPVPVQLHGEGSLAP